MFLLSASKARRLDMPSFLNIEETPHFAHFLADQLRLSFTLAGCNQVNHTHTPELEVFEFQINSTIVSLLLRNADMNRTQVIVESEEKVDEVRTIVENALVQTVISIADKVFEAYIGDPQRLRVMLVSRIQKIAEKSQITPEDSSDAD